MITLTLARLRRLVVGAVLLPTACVVGGCTAVVGARFDEAIPPPTECDLLRPQTSDPRAFVHCDEASTCTANDDLTGTLCYPLRKSGEAGEACEYANDCAPGLACTDLLGCVPRCETGTTCDDGSECIAFEPELAIGGRSFGFCPPPPCDPIHPTNPAPGLASCSSEQCRFVREDRTACFPTQRPARATGAACDDDLDCAPSDSCFDNVCTRICRLERDECGHDEVCVADAIDGATLFFQDETFGHCEPNEKR